VIGPVDAAGFESSVLRARAAVVDFWAPWCKPCDAIEPTLVAFAAAHDLPLVKVDIDATPGLASRYGVLSLPTVVLFVAGEARETVYGAQPRERYERAFGRWVGGAEK
jgi:thioredoxin 1